MCNRVRLSCSSTELCFYQSALKLTRLVSYTDYFAADQYAQRLGSPNELCRIRGNAALPSYAFCVSRSHANILIRSPASLPPHPRPEAHGGPHRHRPHAQHPQQAALRHLLHRLELVVHQQLTVDGSSGRGVRRVVGEAGQQVVVSLEAERQTVQVRVAPVTHSQPRGGQLVVRERERTEQQSNDQRIEVSDKTGLWSPSIARAAQQS